MNATVIAAKSGQLTPIEIFKGVAALEARGFPHDELAAFISEDCVVHEAGSLPFGSDWKGVQGFHDLMIEVRATFPNFHFELDSILANDDDKLAIKARISGDTPGGRFAIPLVEYWLVRDGKAVDVLPMWHDTKLVMDLYNSSPA